MGSLIFPVKVGVLSQALGRTLSTIGWRGGGVSGAAAFFAAVFTPVFACLLALVVLALAHPRAARAQEPPPRPSAFSLALVDNAGAADAQAVREQFRAGQGVAVNADELFTVPGGGALWYQIRLPQVNQPTQFVLTVPQPGINSVDLYRWGTAGGDSPPMTVQRSGDQIPVQAWPVRHLFPAFDITALPDEETVVYLRIQHGNSIGVRWVLKDARQAHAQSQGWHMVLGFYGGLVLTIAMVSGLQAVRGRGGLHGWFMLYVGVVALAQSAMTGVAGEYFWPQAAWWNDRAPAVLGLAGLAMLHLLLRQMVVDRDLRWMPGLLLVMSSAGCALLLAFLLSERGTVFVYIVPYVVCSLFAQLCVSAWYAWRTPRPGIWVLGAVVCLTAGAVFPVLRLLNLIPVSLATQYGAQIGSALEISLLMVALHLRSSSFRDTQRRVGALDRIDPLTGLANHRMLLHRLQRMLTRSQRDPSAGAVMRIRLGNAGDIRQEFGLDVAQTAVVHAGACISSVTQEGDIVARHKDGDFVVLLSGRLSRAQLTAIGQRLIVQGLAPNTQLPPHTVLQLKVVVTEAPFGVQGGALILQNLGSVLDELNGRSGTALRFVSDPGPWRGSRGKVPA